MKPITETAFDPAFLTDKRYFWNRRTKEELALPCDEKDHDALLAIAQNNRTVFSLITSTLPTLGGWTSIEKGCAIAGLVLAMKPQTVVEIGTYAGRSFFCFCVALREVGSGKAIGIDPYNAQISADGESPENSEWWSKVPHDEILASFMSLMDRFKLRSIGTLLRVKSDDAPVPPVIDLWHCDGSHTDQSVKDVARYAPSIPLGGIAILDDLHWAFGGVLRAADLLEEMGFKECYRVVRSTATEGNDWAVYQRIR